MAHVETNFSFNQEIHGKDAPEGAGNSAALAAMF